MPTLKIVKDDKWVDIDGRGCILSAVVLASNVHAVQWDGSAGHVEYNDGTDNLVISDISAYSTIVSDHATKKAAEDAAVVTLAEEQTALANTYVYKRLNDYASYGDQLDQQYKDALNGTTTWRDAITVVKNAHPKP